MITAEENERITRVGPGTPMGEIFRRYWIPALLSDDLPERDCPPVRVRVLGEDLVAFRDTEGRVGLLAENCSHRRASLFYGRNEECGLRCIYHGWKYDVEGNILDTPAEPANSMLKHHVKHRAYPIREVNGVIMAYMGPTDMMPPLPDLPWFTLPREHVRITRSAFNECNWLQTLEGNVDSVHSAFLHARQRETVPSSEFRVSSPPGTRNAAPGTRYRNQQNPPTFEVEERSWGVVGVAHYPADDGLEFVRTNAFVMPCYTALPNGEFLDGRLDGFQVNVEVPVDDYSTWRFAIHLQRSKPIDQSRTRYRSNEVGPDFRKLMNRSNDYLIDREKQRLGIVFSGIDASNLIQDACVTETMGPITDRTQEHLGVTDSQVAEVRHFLLRVLQDMERGSDPPGVSREVEDNDFGDLHVISAAIPAHRYWRESIRDVTTASVRN